MRNYKWNFRFYNRTESGENNVFVEQCDRSKIVYPHGPTWIHKIEKNVDFGKNNDLR